MRHLFLAAMLGGTLCQSALSDDLTTLNGTTYHNFTVVKAENGFLTINYDEGTANIKAEVLPENIRQQYGLSATGSSPTSPKPPDHFNELVLKDGTPYLDVTIIKVEPDSLTVLHKDGGAKIPFENLPDYICKLYDITTEKALQYRASIKQEQKQQQQELAAAAAAAASTNNDNTPTASGDSSTPNYSSSDDMVYVNGYYRKNGTYVNGYYRHK
jgi:hypothetical protein